MLNKKIIGLVVAVQAITVQTGLINPACVPFSNRPGMEHTITVDNQSIQRHVWACVVEDCGSVPAWYTQVPPGEKFTGLAPNKPAALRIYLDWKPSDKDVEIATQRKASNAPEQLIRESSNAVCPVNYPNIVKQIIIGPDQKGNVNNRRVTINRDGTMAVD